MKKMNWLFNMGLSICNRYRHHLIDKEGEVGYVKTMIKMGLQKDITMNMRKNKMKKDEDQNNIVMNSQAEKSTIILISYLNTLQKFTHKAIFYSIQIKVITSTMETD